MNVLEGLQEIHDRLSDSGADPATLGTVEAIMKRAALPAASPASAGSLLQLVRMLMRTPAADSDIRVYNDLARLEDELTESATAYRERVAAEDARPVPRTKKYYKELKERERKRG